MSEYRNNPVIQHLDRLEQANRFWKRMAGALFVLLTTFTTIVLLRSTKIIKTDEVLTANEIRTRRLVVLDEEGKSRIKLGKVESRTSENDGFGLTVLNSEGMTGVELSVKTSLLRRSGLYLYDHLGDYHAGLIVKSSTVPTISDPMLDQTNNIQVDFALLGKSLRDITAEELQREQAKTCGRLKENRAAYESCFRIVEVGHAHAQQSIQLRVGSESQKGAIPVNPYVEMAMRNSNIGAHIHLVSPDDAVLSLHQYKGPPPVADLERGKLQLRMSQGKPSVILGDGVDDPPSLVLGHTSFKDKYGLVEQRPTSSLVLFKKDGNILWKTP